MFHNELRWVLGRDERLSEDFVNDVYYDVDLQEAKRNPSGLPEALSADLYLLSQIFPPSECEGYWFRGHWSCYEFGRWMLAAHVQKNRSYYKKLAKKNSRFVPCSNKKNGCQETFEKLKILDDVIAKHEKECIYRLVPCLNNGNGCKEKVTFQNVIPHFEEKHAKYSGVPLRRQVSLRI